MLRRYLNDMYDCLRVEFRSTRAVALAVMLVGGNASTALGFDPQDGEKVQVPAAAFQAPANPAAGLKVAPPKEGLVRKGKAFLFRFGFTEYRNGNKSEAFKSYQEAADKGHLGAQWALANMYAAGDGTTKDDYAAFEMYRRIANGGANQTSEERGYVAAALVALGGYVQKGIPSTPVKANPVLARDIYWQAAVDFGDANAQFMLGKIYLNGEAGKTDVTRAAKWFNSAANKGHAGARAMLGQLMFNAGKAAKGIGMMTAALKMASPEERVWIRQMQEQAFALSDEKQRRGGIAMAERFIID